MKPKRKRAATRTTYHHGGLRDALMNAALDAVARDGTQAVSLRELARELGVSHSAPGHHFPDRTSLFTALAAEGFARLHTALAEGVAAAANTPVARLNAAGRAYVLFAAENPAYFEVMFHPKLLRQDDPALEISRDNASRVLQEAIAALQGGNKRGKLQSAPVRGMSLDIPVLHAWSVAHGLASLWLNGNITTEMAPAGIEALTRRMFKSE